MWTWIRFRFCRGVLSPQFAILLRRQLFTTEFLQQRQTFSDNRPNNGRGDISVIMPEHVSDTRDLLPGNFRMPGFQLIGQMAARFRNNFDATLNEPLLLPVRLEIIEPGFSNYFVDAFNGLDDIGQAWDERMTRH